MRRAFTSREEAARKLQWLAELVQQPSALRKDPFSDSCFRDRTADILEVWDQGGVVVDRANVRLVGALLVDVFQEALRARSSVKGKLSPWELWKRADDETIDAFVERMNEATEIGAPKLSLTVRNFRYFAGLALPWCANFRADLAHGIVDHCHEFLTTNQLGCLAQTPERGVDWVDPCAGWGDRLLASICNPRVRSYTAFDPNSALLEGHRGIAELAGAQARVPESGRAMMAGPLRIVYEEWENGNRRMPDSCCDLVFTSPPFSDKEHYHCKAEDRGRQAMHAYKSDAEFQDRFVDSLVGNAARILRMGGILALHIPADGRMDVAVFAAAERARLMRVHVVGARSRSRGRRDQLRPVFLWLKVP